MRRHGAEKCVRNEGGGGSSLSQSQEDLRQPRDWCEHRRQSTAHVRVDIEDAVIVPPPPRLVRFRTGLLLDVAEDAVTGRIRVRMHHRVHRVGGLGGTQGHVRPYKDRGGCRSESSESTRLGAQPTGGGGIRGGGGGRWNGGR